MKPLNLASCDLRPASRNKSAELSGSIRELLACWGATGKRVPLLAGKRDLETGTPIQEREDCALSETAESGATGDDPARQLKDWETG